MEQRTLPETMNPAELAAHPALRALPMLSAEQFAALCESVAENGVLEPLVVTPELLVLDGRNRLAAAVEQGLDEVPVREAPAGADPIAYALERATTGRQLTKTGICLLLLEHHPDLAGARAERQKGGLKRGDFLNSEPRVHSVNTGDHWGFRAISERYQVPYQYFSGLCAAFDACRNEWDERRLRVMVYEMEVSASRILPALNGWQAEHPIDEEVGEALLHGEPPPKRAPENLYRVFSNSFRSLRARSERWGAMPQDQRLQLRDVWLQTWAALPADLKKAVQDR